MSTVYNVGEMRCLRKKAMVLTLSISYITKGGSSPENKPRIFFASYPEDFERYFRKISEDVFKTQDCVIYYDNSADEISSSFEEALTRVNLFVIPVTFSLLSKPNRALDLYFKFAKRANIPVLPLMMEEGLDAIYSDPEKFGELQYISPFSHDISEISYEEKLEKYLSSVLVGEETAERVRKAFDAYVFLSYRKKDRKYANQLMALIHSIPELRDIAIWFDEFLTPGESFTENIEKMLQKSDYFTLLVTPNVLEITDSGPNYVMSEEFPSAKSLGKAIIPAMMVDTNESSLQAGFPDIPPCIRASEDAAFRQRFIEALGRIAKGRDNRPEHNFLIGLAYLHGIDVERNVDRALELITDAANAELAEAMSLLVDIYDQGINVEIDWKKACLWAKKLAEFYCRTYGKAHRSTLASFSNLAIILCRAGDYTNALQIMEDVYEKSRIEYGSEDMDTVEFMSNLAGIYSKSGDIWKSFELNIDALELKQKIFGEDSPDVLVSLNNLASSFVQLGDYGRALAWESDACRKSLKLYGHAHPISISILDNLGNIYAGMYSFSQACEVYEIAYENSCIEFGENHPLSLTILNNLSIAHAKLGDSEKAISLMEEIYEARKVALGEDHPCTIASMNSLAAIHADFADYESALKVGTKAYELNCGILGENHPNTLTSLSNLAFTYSELGEYNKAIELYEIVRDKRRNALGEKHPDTIATMESLGIMHCELRDYASAIKLFKEVCEIRCALAKNHPDTFNSLKNLADIYFESGECAQSLSLHKELYERKCEVFGADYPATLDSLVSIGYVYEAMGGNDSALDLYRKAYPGICKALGKDEPYARALLERIEALEVAPTTHVAP